MSACKHKCIGRHNCRCVDTEGMTEPHTQHICSDSTCVCHTAAAWGLERAIVNGREVYRAAETLPAGTLVLAVRA